MSREFAFFEISFKKIEVVIGDNLSDLFPIICAIVDFAQLDEHTDADVQLTGFIFLISRSANITAASL